MDAGEPISLDALFTAGTGGLSRSMLLRHLQKLVELGIVERQGRRQGARYQPLQRMEVSWMRQFRYGWRHLSWHVEPPISHRYPLINRLPDPMARTTLERLLSGLEDQGILTPWRRYQEVVETEGFAEREARILDPRTRRAWRRILTDPGQATPSVIVYGSCARGDARADSDLDVLIWVPYPSRTFHFLHEFGDSLPAGADAKLDFDLPYDGPIMDLVDDINLGAARALDVKVVPDDELIDLPPGLWKAIIEEGMTVWNLNGRWIEDCDWDAWQSDLAAFREAT